MRSVVHFHFQKERPQVAEKGVFCFFSETICIMVLLLVRNAHYMILLNSLWCFFFVDLKSKMAVIPRRGFNMEIFDSKLVYNGPWMVLNKFEIFFCQSEKSKIGVATRFNIGLYRKYEHNNFTRKL